MRDTVLSFNEFNGEGNGFTFFNYNAHDMLHTIERAVEYYHDKQDIWKILQKRGMEGDYSWTHSANEYIKLYESLFSDASVTQQETDDKPNPVVVEID